MREDELMVVAKELAAPLDLILYIHKHGKLPVPNFSAGGVAIPADAALMMQLGAEAVFVGSGIFKSSDPAKRAKAMVDATTYFDKPEMLVEISAGLGVPMRGLEMSAIPENERMAKRGW